MSLAVDEVCRTLARKYRQNALYLRVRLKLGVTFSIACRNTLYIGEANFQWVRFGANKRLSILVKLMSGQIENKTYHFHPVVPFVGIPAVGSYNLDLLSGISVLQDQTQMDRNKFAATSRVAVNEWAIDVLATLGEFFICSVRNPGKRVD
jgi:hypothetical protein